MKERKRKKKKKKDKRLEKLEKERKRTYGRNWSGEDDRKLRVVYIKYIYIYKINKYIYINIL